MDLNYVYYRAGISVMAVIECLVIVIVDNDKCKISTSSIIITTMSNTQTHMGIIRKKSIFLRKSLK